MDNASKALIMAGAVLIAVALVGVGVYLYRSAADTVSGGGQAIADATVQLNNSIITKYVGRTVLGSEVLNLVDEVENGNISGKFAVDLHVKLGGTNGTALQRNDTNILRGGTYKVSVEYNTQGAVNAVWVEQIED